MSTFRALLVLSAVLISSHSAEAQAVRFDYFASTTSAQCAPGKQCPLVVLPGTQVNICGGTVTNLAACLSAPATTYTNAGAGTPCANTSQLTPQTGGSCRATSDNQGNYGFWILPGSYNYFLRVPATAGGGTYGPYPIAIGASAGCPLGVTCDANYSTLAAACSAAGSGLLYVTRVWSGLLTQTLACPLTFTGNGRIKPGSAQTVTLTGTITAPIYQQIFDITAGGVVGVAQRRQEVTWYGANWQNNPAFDSGPAINAAMNSVTFGVGFLVLHIPSGIYYSSSITWTNGVSIEGDGDIVSYISYIGASGQPFVTYVGNNTDFHIRGLTLTGADGHVPSNGLVFQNFLDSHSVIEDIAVGYMSNDCVQVNGWVNLYITGHFRVDQCGVTGLHLIPDTFGFVNNVSINDFTATTVGNQTTQQLIYVDNSKGAAQDIGNIHISNAKFEINALMGSPFAIVRVRTVPLSFYADNITVDNTVAQSSLIFLYTDTNVFPFQLENIRPQSNWFNSVWGTALTGLQTSGNYINSLKYAPASTGNATALRYTLGPPLTTCNIDAGAGTGASCSISTAYHSSNNAFVVTLHTGSAAITPSGVLARILFSVPDLWDFKIPVCGVVGFADFPRVPGSEHISVFATTTTPPSPTLISDATGPTINSTYNVQVICQ